MNKKEFLETSLTQLEKITKVDSSNWSKWIRGENSPTLDVLMRLSKDLDMSWQELIEGLLIRKQMHESGYKIPKGRRKKDTKSELIAA